MVAFKLKKYIYINPKQKLNKSKNKTLLVTVWGLYFFVTLTYK